MEFSEVEEESNAETQSSVLRLKQVWEEFETEVENGRHILIDRSARGLADAHATIGKLDTLRWIRRVSYHVWRIMHYLVGENGRDEIHSPELPTPEPSDNNGEHREA